MLELAARLLALGDVPVALATSIDVIGGSPVPLGSSMAVTADGRILGSVSGGCVEPAALAACRALLAGGPPLVQRYGFGAAEAGVACGGELDVLVHPYDSGAASAALEAAAAGDPAAIGLVVTGSGLGRTVPAATPRAFVDSVHAAPRMLVVGSTETAAALVAAAAAIGSVVTVCDVRAAFLTRDRFPAARALVRRPGHEVIARTVLGPRDAVCVLSHDEDLDPLALAAALESGAGYVGALGSRSTAARRRERLRTLGVDRSSMRRLHLPIGLDLGGRSPAETAVSILAEVLAARTGASRASLSDREGPIHLSPGSPPVREGSGVPGLA